MLRPREGSEITDPVPKGVHRLQVAPMIEVSDHHFRYFCRLLSSRTQLWTEMIADRAVLHTESLDLLLKHHSAEGPVALQLGGCNPQAMAQAASIAVQHYGYSEVNLNAGCPSCRVANSGGFGAELMKKPALVHDVLGSMDWRVNNAHVTTHVQDLAAISSEVRASVGPHVPISIKTRLGVDNLDTPEFLRDFLVGVGCSRVVMHCRKAWLLGLSPAENRFVPTLDYGRAFDVCGAMVGLTWWLNGGVRSLWQAKDLLSAGPSNLEGVMIGRGIIHNPAMLWDADRYLYHEEENPVTTQNRRILLSAYQDFLADAYPTGGAETIGSGQVHMAVKPCLGIFAGLPNQKLFRQEIDRLCKDKAARAELGAAGILEAAAQLVGSEVLDMPFERTEDRERTERLVFAQEETSKAAQHREEVRKKKEAWMVAELGRLEADSRTPDHKEGQSVSVGSTSDTDDTFEMPDLFN